MVDLSVWQVNTQTPLPGGLQLGYVILDDCESQNVAAVQSFAFLPSNPNCNVSSNPPADQLTSYDVVAVMSASTSDRSALSGPALCRESIPLILLRRTRDVQTFPCMLCMVPSQRDQFAAIRSIVTTFNWTLVSAVCQDDSIGREACQMLEDVFKNNSPCLATTALASNHLDKKEATDTISRLMKYNKGEIRAQIVILIAYNNNVKMLTKTAQEVENGKDFVWIVIPLWEDLECVAYGPNFTLSTLIFRPARPTNDHDFLAKMDSKAVKRLEGDNEWFREWYPTHKNTNLTRYVPVYSGRILDTINLLANATSQVLLSPECQGHPGNVTRACVTNERLLAQLSKTHADYYRGVHNLDRKKMGHFILTQLQEHTPGELTPVNVAWHDLITHNTRVINKLSWAGRAAPVSGCGRPCPPGSVKKRDPALQCCWTCLTCRPYERRSEEGCIPCPEFTWSDPESGNRSCSAIPPFMLDWDDVGVRNCHLTVGLVGVVLCVVVLLIHYGIRDNVIIKNCCLPLSVLTLCAMTVGFAAPIIKLWPPSAFTCRLTTLMETLAFCVLYGATLVRGIRNYLLLRAGMEEREMPPLLNDRYLVLYTLMITLVEALADGAVQVVFPVWHGLQQPSREVKYVLRTCLIPPATYTMFLFYNLMLLVACTIVAFVTRKVRNNFKAPMFSFCCLNLTVFVCCIPALLVLENPVIKVVVTDVTLFACFVSALVLVFGTSIYGAVKKHKVESSKLYLPSGDASVLFVPFACSPGNIPAVVVQSISSTGQLSADTQSIGMDTTATTSQEMPLDELRSSDQSSDATVTTSKDMSLDELKSSDVTVTTSKDMSLDELKSSDVTATTSKDMALEELRSSEVTATTSKDMPLEELRSSDFGET